MLLLVPAALGASQADIQLGDTEDAVVLALGEPRGKAQRGDRTVWYYLVGQVEWEAGRVVACSVPVAARREAAFARARQLREESDARSLRLTQTRSEVADAEELRRREEEQDRMEKHALERAELLAKADRAQLDLEAAREDLRRSEKIRRAMEQGWLVSLQTVPAGEPSEPPSPQVPSADAGKAAEGPVFFIRRPDNLAPTAEGTEPTVETPPSPGATQPGS